MTGNMAKIIGAGRVTASGALNLLLWIAGIGMLATNVVLLQQNRAMRTIASGAAVPTLVEGKHLSRTLAAATLDNAFRPIAFGSPESKRTLLITFSPGCPHCRANHKNWSVIANELRHAAGWRIMWVSRDPVATTKDYCESSDIPIAETFADPTFRTYMTLDLKTVPNTMVIDDKGVIEKVWPGELDAAGWKQVFSYLHMPTTLTPSL